MQAKMSGKNDILLLSDPDSSWLGSVVLAMAPLGDLQIVPVERAMDLVHQQPWRMIIVDAAYVDNAPQQVARIRALCPGARIVVATASPTWRQAREAFQAGATDYIRKSLSKKDLYKAFSEAIEKTPPP